MPEFIFYTFEGYTISPNNDELDSMQILGFEEGDTEEIALNNLIANNPWIEECGFDVSKIQSKQTLTKSTGRTRGRVWFRAGFHHLKFNKILSLS